MLNLGDEGQSKRRLVWVGHCRLQARRLRNAIHRKNITADTVGHRDKKYCHILLVEIRWRGLLEEGRIVAEFLQAVLVQLADVEGLRGGSLLDEHPALALDQVVGRAVRRLQVLQLATVLQRDALLQVIFAGVFVLGYQLLVVFQALFHVQLGHSQLLAAVVDQSSSHLDDLLPRSRGRMAADGLDSRVRLDTVAPSGSFLTRCRLAYGPSMLRGILRRPIRRDRPTFRLPARQVSQNSESSEDDGQSSAKDELIAFFKLSLRRIHPEREEDVVQLEDRNLIEERELREQELIETTMTRTDLSVVEKRELIQGLSDWLERAVREEAWVEWALGQLEEPLNRLREIETLARQLEKIPDELNLPGDTD